MYVYVCREEVYVPQRHPTLPIPVDNIIILQRIIDDSEKTSWLVNQTNVIKGGILEY